MNMRRGTTWRWMALFTLMAGLAACQRPPDEQQVRQAIAAGAKAAEAADAGGFGDVVSDGFDGNEGGFDRRRLLGMLRLMRLRGEHMTVLMGPVSVEPRGQRYVATFTVTLGSGNSRLLPRRLGVYHVTSAWRLENGDWHCYSAHWKRRM